MGTLLTPKYFLSGLLIFLAGLTTGAPAGPVPEHPLALQFAENKGQVADLAGTPRPDILFTAHSGGGRIFLAATRIYYQFSTTTYPAGYTSGGLPVAGDAVQQGLREQVKTSTYRFDVALAGANPDPVIRREAAGASVEHFYLAHCPQGIRDVHSYERIIYENVYPGIDWVIYGKGLQMKYDFVVRPGADPAQIRLKISDVQSVGMTAHGDLVMKTSLGYVTERAPVSFSDGREVKTHFVRQSGTISFRLAPYNHASTLIIDPSVAWSTYYGGSGEDQATGTATDAGGNVFLAGDTKSSTGIATTGGLTTSYGGDFDAFLAKFSPAGARFWATYYGGTGEDRAGACATDTAGNVYLTGSTHFGAGLSTAGAFQTTYGGGSTDGYLLKLNGAGARLWATYFGGGNEDAGLCLSVDDSSNVFLGGYTRSSGLGNNGFQNNNVNEDDGILAKFSSSGALRWSTYYGDSGFERILGCAADHAGNIYASGYSTSSNGIASSGAYQTTLAGVPNQMLVKFNLNGTRQWATYYGSYQGTYGTACATDRPGNVYMAGFCYNYANLTGFTGFQMYPGGGVASTLIKFSPSGALIRGTYYGGPGDDFPTACVVDAYDNVYMAGNTTSDTSIARGGFQNARGGNKDAYIVQFDSSGARQWGSYFGGSADDYATACAVGPYGTVYLAGGAASGGVAAGGHQTTFGGVIDAFLMKIQDTVIITGAITGAPLCAGRPLSVPFTATRTPNSGNIYTAQLSNASGAFTSPTVIGTLSSVAVSGAIPATIPVSTAAGAGYRIRVLSSSPGRAGQDNGAPISINAAVVPTVSASVSPGAAIGPNVPLTFTAAYTGGGISPLFQWKLNGNDIPGATAATYITNSSSLANGDAISVTILSDAPCAVTTPTASAPVILTISATGVASAANWAGTVSVYPNPVAAGSIRLEAGVPAAGIGATGRILLINSLGQEVYRTDFKPAGTHISIAIPIDNALAAGLYILKISLTGMQAVVPVVIRR